jgi:preprotein translocase subunit SecG
MIEPLSRIRMTIIITIIHVIVCFFLIVVVLLQSGKAADLAGAFGGMGSQTAFGPRGSATLLSKATTLAAALFMVTSLSLAILATRGAASSGSVLEKIKAPASTTAAPEKKPKAPKNQTPGAPVQSLPAPVKK